MIPTMLPQRLRVLLAALLSATLVAGSLATWGATTAHAQHEDDDDGDWVLESDEVSGEEDEEESGSTTTIIVKDTDPEAVVVFRDRLSPYGTWMDHPTYGTVWVPASRVVGPDFAPYVSRGHWELTEDGDWLWVSDYEWGYIPFHYGRWVWISGVGWSWIPGRVYAPAWVVWRVGAGGYIGWAAMPPGYYWVDGVAIGIWYHPHAAYAFCPTRHVFHHHVHHHVVHDHAEVRRAADATVAYQPASTKTKQGHTPASPTVKEAGIDDKSVPKSFGKHHPKAVELMKKPPSKARPTSSHPKSASKKGTARSVDLGASDSPPKASRSRGGDSADTAGSRADAPRVVKRRTKLRKVPRAHDAPSRSNPPAEAAPPSRPSDGEQAPPSRKPSKSDRSGGDGGDRGSSESRPSAPSEPKTRPSSPSRSSPSSPPASKPSAPSSSAKRPPAKPAPKGPARGPSRGRR